MADIDPIEFGKLCANVESTHNLVKEMDRRNDNHHDRITELENTNSTLKKAVKWVSSGAAAVWGLITWVMN